MPLYPMSDVKKTLSVGIGDIKIAKAPAVISTYLGSCVAVCLYSPPHKAGGLIHLMLPRASLTKEGHILKKEKYADTGIPELLHQLKTVFKLEKEDFIAKIFGGANILRNVNRQIGNENVEAARDILRGLNIRIVVCQTGGDKGYKVEFDLNTGKVLSRVFGEEPKEY